MRTVLSTTVLSLVLGVIVIPPTSRATVEQLTSADPLGYGLLDGSSSLAIVDLNRDKRPEIVVANRHTNTVSVLLNNGNGSFTLKYKYATGPAPSAIVAGDINRDGKQDIIVANSGADTVSIFLGNGDGTLARPKDLATGAVPSALVIADLNRDNAPDLLVVNRYGNSISVLLGKANGTLGAKVDYACGFLPYSSLVSDVNRDGNPDLLVTSCFDHIIAVLPGKGDGTFGRRTRYAMSKRSCALLMGNLIGDKISIIEPHRYGYVMSVQHFKENGTPEASRAYLSGKGPRSMVAADFNKDGNLDLAVSNAGHLPGDSGSVFVFLGTGGGAFELKATVLTGNASHSLATGDFNGDGNVDIAVLNGSYDFGGSVSVLLGSGDGTFLPRADYATGGYMIWVSFGEDANGKSKQVVTEPEKPRDRY